MPSLLAAFMISLLVYTAQSRWNIATIRSFFSAALTPLPMAASERYEVLAAAEAPAAVEASSAGRARWQSGNQALCPRKKGCARPCLWGVPAISVGGGGPDGRAGTGALGCTRHF